MSIASEITRLQGVKSDILQAIADKGVTVPVGSMLDDCPALIASISGGGAIHQDFVDKTILGDTYKCVEISNGIFFPIENLHYKDANIDYITSSSSIDVSQSQCFYYNCDESTYKDLGYLYTYSAIQHIDTLITNTSIKKVTSGYVNMIYAYIRNLIEAAQSVIPGNYVDNPNATYLSEEVGVGWNNALGKVALGFRPNGYYLNGEFGGIGRYLGIGSDDNNFIDIQNAASAFRFVSIASWPNRHGYGSRFIIDEN